MPQHLNTTQAELKKILHYDPETGLFTWTTSRRRPISWIKPGDAAGHKCRDGYIRIMFSGKLHYAARLAFLFMTGEFPSGFVDHINRIKDDNRWINLRNAENKWSDNAQNVNVIKNSKSGYTGVTYDKNPARIKKWVANIRHNKKLIWIGHFHTPEEAHAAYLAKKRELHPFFAG